jgi:hypothetical protein
MQGLPVRKLVAVHLGFLLSHISWKFKRTLLSQIEVLSIPLIKFILLSILSPHVHHFKFARVAHREVSATCVHMTHLATLHVLLSATCVHMAHLATLHVLLSAPCVHMAHLATLHELLSAACVHMAHLVSPAPRRGAARCSCCPPAST